MTSQSRAEHFGFMLLDLSDTDGYRVNRDDHKAIRDTPFCRKAVGDERRVTPAVVK